MASRRLTQHSAMSGRGRKITDSGKPAEADGRRREQQGCVLAQRMQPSAAT